MRKLIGDTVIVSTVAFLNQSKGIVFIPLIVGALGLEGYGAFVQILLAVRLVSSFATLELGMGFPRFASGPEAEPPREAARHFYSVLAPTLLLGGLGASFLFLGAGRLSNWFFDAHFRGSLELASLVVVSNGCFGMARNYLRARRHFKLQSTLTLLYEFLPYLAFVAIATVTREFAPALLAYAAVDVAVAAATLLVAAVPLRPTLPSLEIIRRYLRYSIPLALSYGQGILLARVNLFFVSALIGLEAMAIYNVVYRLTQLVSSVSIPINVQILSYLSRAWDSGLEGRSRDLLRKTLLVTLLIAVGLLAPIALYCDSLFALFLGESAPATPLWPLVTLIGLGMLANIVCRFFYMLIRLHRTTHHELRYQLLGLSINVVANLLLIPRFGLVGAAFATLLSYTVTLPVISLRYPLGLDAAFLGHLASFAFLALVTLLPRFAIAPDSAPLLVLSAGLASCSYLLAILLFKWKLLRSFWDDLGQWQRLPYTTRAST
jgi:O-antigen/teichoic acid export membrane protein